MAGLADYLYKLILRACDEGYPEIVHLPHTLLAMQQYRSWRQAEKQPTQWLFDLCFSYVSHSQGGGCVGKGYQLGWHNMNTFRNPQHLQFHLIGYLLTYWSPRNIVYRTVSQPRNPLRLFCVAMDSLDASTTTCALVDAGRKLHPTNSLLPYLTGVLVYQSGAFFRLLDLKCRGRPVKSFLVEPGSGVKKGFVLALLWWHLGRGQKRNNVLVSLSAIYLLLDLLEDVCGFDAFANLHKPFVSVLQALQKTFSLGQE